MVTRQMVEKHMVSGHPVPEQMITTSWFDGRGLMEASLKLIMVQEKTLYVVAVVGDQGGG
jgi:hypothetical protein